MGRSILLKWRFNEGFSKQIKINTKNWYKENGIINKKKIISLFCVLCLSTIDFVCKVNSLDGLIVG